MKKHIQIGVLFFILLPLLTGCFQQAGEAMQPASLTEAPILLPDITNTPPEPGVSDTEVATEPALTDLPATDIVPGVDITVISPTRILGASATPTPPPTLEGEVPTAEIQTFRTPVSPLGPVTPDTPVPTLSDSNLPATPSGLITPTALPGIGSAAASGECTYTIQRGETLFRIALAHDTTVNDIVAANPGINPNVIQPGQVINLPGCTGSAAPEVPAPDSGGDTPVNPPPAGGTTYTVQRGDTLFAIAQRFGVTVQAIVEANALTNPNTLDVGQQLIIPPSS